MFDRRLRAFYDLWKDGFKNGSSGLTNIYIEKSGNTRLIDALETEYGSYIINTDLPRTTNKFSRFLNAQGFIENGKVYVPDAEIEIRGRGKARAFLETFFDECEAFTDNPKDYENDDIVDCLSDACYITTTKPQFNMNFSNIFG
jgi:predicted phage terminase large subunit-like protein